MGNAARPVADRFWEKVVKHDEGCWEWNNSTDKDGYGVITVGTVREGNRRQERAPRVSWIIHFGAIPASLWVLHHCDNPPCTRPDHLYLGTAKQNGADKRRRKRAAKSRWTHCAQGHEFTPQNTHIRTNGCRTCRACMRGYSKKYYDRKKAAA